MVNRLTRELTLLRQQTASAASNASSASTSTAADSAVQTEGGVLLGSAIQPTSSRRHRSSSNLGSRAGGSISSTGATAGSASGVNTTTHLTGSGIAPPRDASYSYSRSGGDPLSRQSSVASRRSEASSPSLSSSLLYTGTEQHPFPASSHHRHSHSNSFSTTSVRGPTTIPTTHRYDEAAHNKAELDMVKAENEALKGRIRELERMVRQNPLGEGGDKDARGENTERQGSSPNGGSAQPQGSDNAAAAEKP